MANGAETRISVPTIIQEEREPLQDHCGILAAYATGNVTFFETGLTGLKELQTRGYDGAGFWAVSAEGEYFSHKAEGTIDEAFPETAVQEAREIQAQAWVYQVRYGTNGGFIPENVQPVIKLHKKTQKVVVTAHNGEFNDGIEDHTSDTVRFARELSETTEDTWDDRIKNLLAKKQGAWSLAIYTEDGLYLARDAYGIRPLVYGSYVDKKTGHMVWVAASETSALEAMGIHTFQEVLPGQIIRIDKEGPHVIQEHNPEHPQAACTFEAIYLAGGPSRV